MIGMADQRPATVVMMCGVAGSGKTAFALRLQDEGFVRLSIDEEIWRRFGRYGLDCDASEYAEHSTVAEQALRGRLTELVRDGRDVVLDFSFWQRADRDRYKRLIESVGGRWRLIYLKVNPQELGRRLAERNQRFDANAAFAISAERLAGYLASFEEPVGGGAEVRTASC
jgi:predicted kinase